MAELIGEQLRKAREERKLTLEQVFQAIRINVRYLKALENEDRESLPSSVQAKGYLRLYADYLGLPFQPLLDTWDGKVLPPPAPEAIVDKASPVQDQLPSTPILAGPLPDLPEAEDEPTLTTIEWVEQEDAVPPEEENNPSLLSQSIFIEIGKQLRERRESLSLSLTDVEHYTRLRKHYLEALETGKTADLPSLVQGRGMLSNYAKFLELDAEALLLRFAEALQERRIENLPPAPRRTVTSRQKSNGPKVPPALRRFITPDLMIGGLVIVIIVGFAIWAAAQVSALRIDAKAPTAPPIANVLISTLTPEVLQTAETVRPGQAAPSNNNVDPAQSVDQPPAGEVTPTALPVIGDAPIQVYVIARERAYLKVSEDGKVKFMGRVVPGNAYPFSGKDKIELSTGNAAGLQVFFNQQDQGTLGLDGQAVNLIYTAKGVVKPTPLFSATPTNTTVPTLTPKPSATLVTPTVTPFIP
jgi:cytoskeleton protein RodZ